MTEAVPVFSTPSPKIRRVGLDRPWAWLAAGWGDLRKAPAVSLGYGLVFALAGFVILALVWAAGISAETRLTMEPSAWTFHNAPC